MESFALEKLAVELNGTPLGAKDSFFTNLQDSRTCDENSLCFVRDAKFLATLSPNAGAVITTEALAKEIRRKQALASALAPAIHLRMGIVQSSFGAKAPGDGEDGPLCQGSVRILICST